VAPAAARRSGSTRFASSHGQIDLRLPTHREKDILADLASGSPPVTVTGARDDPEAALANLLAALAALGLITDSTLPPKLLLGRPRIGRVRQAAHRSGHHI